MNNTIIYLLAFLFYTALLFLISWVTARKAGSNSFFSGDRKAPWAIVAYGMIGSSISGVTFISVPGNVMAQNFYYLPLVFGFGIGYIVVAKLLLPLYYRMNVTSIYSYLGERLGVKSYRTGTVFFMISRVLGAAVRIFIVIIVLYTFVPKSLFGDMPGIVLFGAIALFFLIFLFLYTFKGGVKTIIWTDVLQTSFMLLAVFFTIYFVCRQMGWTFGDMCSNVGKSGYSKIFDMDRGSGTNVFKQLIAGVFMTVTMTGLDQGMMQKNLACKDLGSAQKNMYSTAVIIIVVNVFFLLLGALLSIYVAELGGLSALGISKTDEIFPLIASKYLGTGVGVLFLIGLISAAYPSAGAALTALTSSFCIDFLHFENKENLDQSARNRIRVFIHAGFTLLFFAIIIILFLVSNDAVINLIYKLASYTYGPLLGLFFFGIFTKYKIKDGAAPYIAVAAPIACFIINFFGKKYLGFDLGFSLLIVNGALTFLGLLLFRKSEK